MANCLTRQGTLLLVIHRGGGWSLERERSNQERISRLHHLGTHTAEDYFAEEVEDAKHHGSGNDQRPYKNWLSNLPDDSESNTKVVGNNLSSCLTVNLSRCLR